MMALQLISVTVDAMTTTLFGFLGWGLLAGSILGTVKLVRWGLRK